MGEKMGISVVKQDFMAGSALLLSRLVSNFVFVGCSAAKILPVAIKGQRFGAFCTSVMRCSHSTLLLKKIKTTKTYEKHNPQIPSFPWLKFTMRLGS